MVLFIRVPKSYIREWDNLYDRHLNFAKFFFKNKVQNIISSFIEEKQLQTVINRGFNFD